MRRSSRILGFVAFAILAIGVVALITSPVLSGKRAKDDPGTGIVAITAGL